MTSVLVMNLQLILQDSEIFVPLWHKSWLICSNPYRLDITPMMSFLLPITEQRDGIPKHIGNYPNDLFPIVLYAAKQSTMIKRTYCTEVRVTVKMVYPVLIKVRAYTRFRLGRIEKVRSHYRRYWGIWCKGKDWAERLTISSLCFYHSQFFPT